MVLMFTFHENSTKNSFDFQISNFLHKKRAWFSKIANFKSSREPWKSERTTVLKKRKNWFARFIYRISVIYLYDYFLFARFFISQDFFYLQDILQINFFFFFIKRSKINEFLFNPSDSLRFFQEREKEIMTVF